MRAPILLALSLATVLASAATAQPPKTPAQQVQEAQQRNAESLKQFPTLQPMQDAVKTECEAKAGDDKTKAAQCSCGAVVTVQLWMDDKFMREKLDAYIAKPTPDGIKDALNYHSPDLYTPLCTAAAK
jgi:hypothetical protein